jgi:hypothetical protein
MSDIFISYAREDRPRAQQLAEALAGQGWDVWWDYSIAVFTRKTSPVGMEMNAMRGSAS